MFYPVIAAALVLALATSGVAEAQARAQPADLAIRELLVGLLQREPEGFASAKAPWRFSFPADHAAHPDYWTESWHFTGGALSSRGRQFGFQLTFLRIGVRSPGTPLGPSAFAARDVYWAQFALTDVGAKRTHAAERISRAAMGFAGAQHSPVRVWLEDWMLEVRNEAGEGEVFQLRAADHNMRLELWVRSAKGPVISTAADVYRISDAANPFHAYAMTRLLGKGAIQIGSESFDVDSRAWLDRAWGRIPVPVGAVVWDRFLVQLDDGREIMAIRLRRRDGGGEPTVTGMLIDRDGSARTLPQDTLQADVLEYWSSPQGTRHPVAWRLRIPREHLELRLTPILAAQERPLSLLSWAGAMRVSGAEKGRAVEGTGYMELAASL